MRAWGLVALLFGLSSTRWAMAQTAPESADALFVRARALMKAGDCANALPLLERSHAMDPTVGARFNMALCESRLGKLTEAHEHLLSVIDASPTNDERRAHAERALRELVPRIPQLVLELDETRHRIELVRLDGEPLPALRVNEPFAINPGSHELEVVLARAIPQIRRFNISERQVYTWSLGGVSAAPTADSGTAAKASAGASSAALAIPPASDESPAFWTTQRTAAAVAAGTSLAAFGVATGFLVSARSIYDGADCQNDVCEPDGVEQRERARDHGRIATVAFTVGVASAVAAGTLWFIARPAAPKRSPAMRVGISANGWTERAFRGSLVFEASY